MPSSLTWYIITFLPWNETFLHKRLNVRSVLSSHKKPDGKKVDKISYTDALLLATQGGVGVHEEGGKEGKINEESQWGILE